MLSDRTLVTTAPALETYLTAASPHEVAALSIPDEARDLVTRIETAAAVFLIHASDGPATPRIIFEYRDCLDQLPASGSAVTTALQRARRAAVSARTPPLRLNPAWSEYHSRDLVAFFATPREQGSLRWTAQTNPDGTKDLLFCRLEDGSKPVALHSFHPKLDEYHGALQGWADALEQAKRRFSRRTREAAVQVVATVDLEAATYGAVVGDRTYGTWLPMLTDAQRRFLERPEDASIKLRGPAGTGKTLLLQLKALHEHYAAVSRGADVRTLFVTHSWSMAEQVDAGLTRLHDRPEPRNDVLVYPLLSIAQDLLPTERQGRGFELLGEDNLSGKLLQLQEISRLVQMTVERDWLTYEDRCGADFAERATATVDSPEHRAFIWDLMQEFACVLSAHGILPGVNAARNYLPMQRMPWMMPLNLDGEKLFVLAIYTSFVNAMREQHLLTTDQLINDFHNYLETFVWNLRRAEVGFDLIFVDELHLFNEQERMALSFLSRDPTAHPLMFMALDPRQSPAESYTQAGVASVAGSESGVADAALGKSKRWIFGLCTGFRRRFWNSYALSIRVTQR